MAATSLSGTVTNITNDRNSFTLSGTLAFAAGDYATPGVILDFTSLTYPPGQGPLPVSSAPYDVVIKSQQAAGSGADGLFSYNFNKGTTQANGKVQIFTGAAAQSPLDEFDNGTLPAGVTGDVITFQAKFLKL